MNRNTSAALLASVFSIACWCTGDTAAEQPAAASDTPTGVHSITLPNLPPDLPDRPGRDAVTSACVICHSNRYITMQPRFARKTWEAEVDKMRKTFGAPVSDDQAKLIVNYLVSIRGTDEPAAPAAKQ